jgi:uncharacterized protein YndB with AHSA1/START domain
MTYSLKLVRMIDATPDEVFDAFTDANAQKEWYRDQPEWRVDAGGELRAGGRWEVAFGPTGEAPYREVNVFSEVSRPSRLVYVSTFLMPDGSSFDTKMLVTFEARDGRTLLTIVQSEFLNEEHRDAHQGGWPGFLDRLERVVAARRGAAHARGVA